MCSKIKRLILTILILFSFQLAQGQYIAYSLNSAKDQLENGQNVSDIKTLCQMNRLLGIVYDEKNEDVYLVGYRDLNSHSKLSLDDFAVSLRAIFKYKEWPLVSIELKSNGETQASQIQDVIYGGGVAGTGFGKSLLEADVILKKIALGIQDVSIWGVDSYLAKYQQDVMGSNDEDNVFRRFWFVPGDSFCAIRDQVAVVEDLKIEVSTEIDRMQRNGQLLNASDMPAADAGTQFALDLTGNYEDISLNISELRKMTQLFYMVSFATCLSRMNVPSGSLDYWINHYQVEVVVTASEHPLLVQRKEVTKKDGTKVNLIVEGGVELRALLLELEERSADAFKELVIRSKPTNNCLWWEVPLKGWENEYDSSSSIEIDLDKYSSFNNSGTPIISTISATPNYQSWLPKIVKYNTPTIAIPTFPRQQARNYQPNVGGVMLENVAKISGDDDSIDPLDMAGAKFSFMVDGKDARLDPKTFRKFITALWAVYYSNEDPGLSIDPIAPGADKHMVRYIGQVINTDLGRVMRDADYLMKEWAVGTKKPNIEGFKSPLDYAADAGMLSVGAWSRFWFVPKDMQFRRSDNMLLFESGRMTVQTEYMFQGFGSGADPANQKFADFFTEHYEEIAKNHPIYQELYDYAKMVSLAKYLKDSGVPLFWFIMANKDLVITEDSISTVDALVKNSLRFEGVQIEGGVELGSQGQYIYDNAAIEAINSARAKSSSISQRTTSLGISNFSNQIPTDSFSFKMGERSLTVLPQHSASSGKDYRGIRYQTDFAIRESGYQLTSKKCEQLKFEIFRQKYAKLLFDASDSEGNLPELGIERIIEDCWNIAEARSINLINNLKPLVNKDIKNKAKFLAELGKYIPRNEYELWNEIIAQHAEYNTCLELVRFFNPNQVNKGDFGPGWNVLIPYQIKPKNKEIIEFQGIVMPKKIALVNRLSGEEEVLSFDAGRFNAAAYISEDITKSQVVGLFLMTDGTFRLLDKIQNEFEFNGAGYLTDMIFSERHIVRFEYQKDFAATLERPPYKIERADGEWIQFRTVRLPEKLKVVNLLDGSSEEMVFTEERALVGYEPVDSNNTSVQFLALMNDLSYRMLDKNENEILFNQSGIFRKMISSSEEYLVKSMSSGNYKVQFDYSISKKGEPIIVQATLHKEGESDRDITMTYAYGSDGRLSNSTVKDNNAEIAFNF